MIFIKDLCRDFPTFIHTHHQCTDKCKHKHHYKHRCKGRPVGKTVKGRLGEVNSASPYFTVQIRLDGTKDAVFHVNIIDLLDKVIILDSLHLLSIEQERLFTRYLKQAEEVSNKINLNEEKPFEDMDEVLQELDNFLGSYYGVDYGRFAR